MKNIISATSLLFVLLSITGCPNIPVVDEGGSALRSVIFSSSELDGTFDGFVIITQGEIEIFDDPNSPYPSTSALYSFEFDRDVPDTASKINRCQVELPVNRARGEDVNDYFMRYSHVSYYLNGGAVEMSLLSNPDSPDPSLRDIEQIIPANNINNGGMILFEATDWCRENFQLRRERMQIWIQHDAFLIEGQSVEIILQEGIPFGDTGGADPGRRPRLIVDYE